MAAARLHSISRPEWIGVPHDGDDLKLGGTVFVAYLTTGHTKGCST
jgi:glyoxylase-like metal-dependent hydrolase (beta-lactamase superfamily II)